MARVELVDRLILVDGQVCESDRPALGIILEVEAEFGLGSFLRQRARRAQQDGRDDDCRDWPHPPDRGLKIQASA